LLQYFLFAGDPAAIRSLAEQYQSLVLITTRGFVRNTEDARDIAQEVFNNTITNHRNPGLKNLLKLKTFNNARNFLINRLSNQ